MRAQELDVSKSGGDRYRFRILFIEEPGKGKWSAQVLEHDIATQADSLQDLFFEVERILVSYIALAAAEGRVPFEDIPPAPRKYWDVYGRSAIAMHGRKAGLRQKQSEPPRISSRIRIAARLAA